MDKLANGLTGYIEKESKRYVLVACYRQLRLIFLSFFPNRLESILSKSNLAPGKLDELKIKVNILKLFVEPPEEAPKETVSREEAKLRMDFCTKLILRNAPKLHLCSGIG